MSNRTAEWQDNLIAHKLWIALGSVALLYLCDHCFWHDSGFSGLVQSTRKDIYVVLSTTFGALFGFVLTAYSIVISLNSSTVLARLKERGKKGEVLAVFTSAAYIVGFAAVIALIAIFVDSSNLSNRVLEYVVFGFTVWATLSILGTVFLLSALVEAADK